MKITKKIFITLVVILSVVVLTRLSLSSLGSFLI
jgi:hypothetical protein